MGKLIVTGASRGIGFAIIERFALNGFDVVFCGRHEETVRAAESQLRERFNTNITGITCDLSLKSEVVGFASKASDILGGCDVLVNNAGIYLPGSIENEADGVFELQMAINLNAAYFMSKKIIPVLKNGTRPHLFNMCSIASKTAYPDGSSYCISKFALLGLSKVLREELKPAGIAVTAVMPGATITDSWNGTEFPESRFILPGNVADAVWNAYSINENAVIEELLIRPLAGDI